jgi:hypothetical protein
VVGNEDVTAPFIDNPQDITFEEGSTGHNITWTPSDANPFYYNLTRNGATIMEGSWDNSSITTIVDGLPSGVYTFTCTVFDKGNHISSDAVVVTVTTPPTTPTTPTTTNTPTDGNGDELPWSILMIVLPAIVIVSAAIVVVARRKR